ncbi:MAG: peptide deformylase [Candidatus Riesia sp.]|nr:peptide deformylase [Candidatus Riesia sp.]
MSYVSDESLLVKTKQVIFPLSIEVQNICNEIIQDLTNNKLAKGLSANQLGHDYAIFGMKLNNEVVICINPSFIPKSVELYIATEGCLSICGQSITTKRYKHITASFISINNVAQQIDLSNKDSACFQHETDHTNGIIMLERQIGVRGLQARKQMQRIRLSQQRLQL